jgi:hypothetical protein
LVYKVLLKLLCGKQFGGLWVIPQVASLFSVKQRPLRKEPKLFGFVRRGRSFMELKHFFAQEKSHVEFSVND